MTNPIIDELLTDATNAGLSPSEYVYIKVSATSFSLVTEQRVTDPVVETYQWLERLVAALIADRGRVAEEHFDIGLRLFDAEADWEALHEVNIRLAREVLKAEVVVDKALNVSDSNYRRLEDSLRKSGWIAGADEVQVLRKALAAIHTDRDEAW